MGGQQRGWKPYRRSIGSGTAVVMIAALAALVVPTVSSADSSEPPPSDPTTTAAVPTEIESAAPESTGVEPPVTTIGTFPDGTEPDAVTTTSPSASSTAEPADSTAPAVPTAAAVPADNVSILADWSMSPATHDFGSVRVGEASETIRLDVHAGDAVGGLRIGWHAGIEILGASPCGPHADCWIDVRFAPLWRGEYVGQVVVFDETGIRVSMVISGVGLDDAATLTPSSLAFGPVAVGATSASQVATLTNVGDYPLDVSDVDVTGPFQLVPGGTNPCAARPRLAIGNTCTVGVAFAPTVAGPASGDLVVTTAQTGAHTTTLSGVGATPMLDVTPTSLALDDTPVGQTSTSDTSVVVENSGLIPVSPVFSTSSDEWVLGESTCGAELAPGATCRQVVHFRPSQGGARTGQLVVESAAPTVTVGLTGFGEVRAVDVAPDTIDFGALVVGATSDRDVIVTNDGNVAMTVSTPPITLPAAVSLATSTCDAPVAPGDSCTLTLRYTSPNDASVMSASATVHTSSGDASLQLAGRSLALSLGRDDVDFGTVTVGHDGTPQTVVVSNLASIAVPVTIDAPNAPFAASDDCPDSLPGGHECTITVGFAPAAIGAANGTLAVSTSAGGSQTVEVALTGTGASAELSAGPADIGEVAVGATGSRSVTLTNAGAAALRITGLATTAPFAVASTTCTDAVLGPLDTCTVDVSFTPSEPGPVSADLTVTHRGGTFVTGLDGFGATAGLLTVPDTVDFGRIVPGAVSDAATVTVSNTGNVAVVLDPATVTGPFEIVADDCAGSLVAGTDCTVDVRYTPGSDADGAEIGRLGVTGSGTGGPVATSAALAGYATIVDVAVAPAAVDFGTVAVGRTVPSRTVTVTNTGNVGVSIDVDDVADVAGALRVDASACAGVALDPGSSCELIASYDPLEPGDHTVTVDVGATAEVAGGPHTIEPLAVTVAGSAEAAALGTETETVDLGDVEVGSDSDPSTVVVRNDGPEVTVTDVTVPAGYVVTDDGCSGVTLATGESCELVVVFRPTSVGTVGGSLTITADADGAILEIALSGTGQAGDLGTSPTSIDFGPVAVGSRSQPLPVTLTNDLEIAITVTDVALQGGAGPFGAASPGIVDGEFEVDPSGCLDRTLAAGSSCTVTVTFTPRTVGTSVRTLVLETDLDRVEVAVRGVGVAPGADQTLPATA